MRFPCEGHENDCGFDCRSDSLNSSSNSEVLSASIREVREVGDNTYYIYNVLKLYRQKEFSLKRNNTRSTQELTNFMTQV